MNNVRILLTDPVNGYLNVKAGTAFPLTFSLGDIRDISKRNGSYSKTVTLVGNKNNNQLLGNLYDVNMADGSFDINVLQSCLVEQDGIVILDNMYIQLTSIKKIQLGSTHDIEIEYEAQLKDSSSDFFLKIGNKELNDLDFSGYNHIFNTTNVINSYSNTYVDGFKYMLPYLFAGNQYALTELRPAMYLRNYWDQIFDAAGYTYTFDEADDFEIQFDKLILPWNGDEAKPDEDLDQWVIAEMVANVPVTYTDGDTIMLKQPTIFDTIIKDVLGYYNSTNGEYTIPFDVLPPNSIAYEFEINFDAFITNNQGYTVSLQGPGDGVDYSNKYHLQQQNGLNPATIEYGSRLHVPANTVLLNGQSYQLATGYTEKVTVNISDLIAGNIIESFINIRRFGTNGGTLQTWKDLGDNNDVVDITLIINSFKVTIKPNLQTFLYNSTITLNSFIPKKVKQSDLIKSICQMYNLYIETDRDDVTNLIIKTRDKFYDDGVDVDWTDKLAKDETQDLQFLPELSSKKLILTYKADSDTPNTGYQSITNEVYGELQYVFANEYVKNIERKELIFSPTPNAYTEFGANVPILIGSAPKVNLRILLDNGEYTCNTYTLTYSPTIAITSSVDVTTYPLLSHFNDAENPTFDINYGICEYYFYSPDSITNNNLYNLHWRRTLGQINAGKLLSAYFNLDAVDIQKLRLNNKIRIDNSWWNINKVADYDANKNDLTLVELISIDDDLELPDFNSNGVTVGNLTGNIFLPAPGDTYLGGTGDNRSGGGSTGVFGGFSPLDVGRDRFQYLNIDNTNGVVKIAGSYNEVSRLTTGIITGDNNIINAAGYSQVIGSNNTLNSPAYISGSDNIVDEQIENIFVFGRNEETFTDTNTFYTNNINLSLGSTINGTPVIDLGILEKTLTTPDTDYSILNKDKGHTLNITAVDCIIAGGNSNTITAPGGSPYNSILGGRLNTISVTGVQGYHTILGGFGNDITMGAGAQSFNSILGGTTNSILIGTSRGVIIGGTSNTLTTSNDSSVIIGGTTNTITGFDRSVILGGTGISAIADDTVYVPFFNIRDLFVGTAVTALAVDASGNVVDGSSLPIPTSSTWEDVLTNGNTSGPNNPVLTDGSSIGGGEDPGVAPAVNILNLGDSLAANFTWYLGDRDNNTSALRYDGTHTSLSNAVGNIYLSTSIVYQQDSYRDAHNHTVQTNNNTVTDIYTFVPDSEGIWIIEANVTGLRYSNGDAITSKMYAGFKVIAGVVTQISTTTLDRKSNFGVAITTQINTNGTNIRVRVVGQNAAVINWKSSITITK